MVAPAAVIDAAFEAYSQYAKLVITNDTSVPHDGSARDPLTAMYSLLTDKTRPDGPNAVYIAMKQVQQFVLGTQGADTGVMSYLPRLVSDQYKTCSMDTSKLVDLSPQLGDNFGPFYDTFTHTMRDCVNSTFTLQGTGSATGMAVQAIAQKILVTQFKGIAVLMAAYGADPLNQFFLTDYIMPNMERIGQNFAALWPAITQDVDMYAMSLVWGSGNQLSVNRANQYWMEEFMGGCSDNGPDCWFNSYNDWAQHGLPSGMAMGMLQTACTSITNGFPAGTVYPCLITGPADPAYGYTNNAAVVFRFGKSGPNGIEYYFNKMGRISVPAPHESLPATPAFIKTIMAQYPSGSNSTGTAVTTRGTTPSLIAN